MPNNRVQQGIWVATANPETVDDGTLFAAGFLGGRVIVKQPGPSGSPGAEEYLADAYMATSRATELVKQLLRLARGTTRTTRDEVADLVTVVRDVASLCRRTFERSIEFKTMIELEHAVTPGNLGQLEQVVLNLCLNARDALAGRAGPCIELHLVAVPEPLGDEVESVELVYRKGV